MFSDVSLEIGHFQILNALSLSNQIGLIQILKKFKTIQNYYKISSDLTDIIPKKMFK